ncbi:MAG: HAD family phosphatase [Terracidiphilus sp.]|nr:HAD family phosphatase [Terracidiphilus sp.]MDR3775454.1 HAD family phosphatase [Terracidiphilus sp.]
MLKAVIFDYGMVLTGPQCPKAIDTALRVTGLNRAHFDQLYWEDRHAYDEGSLTGLEYWQKILAAANLNPSTELIKELIYLDGRMWLTENTAMLRWQERLKAAGLKTAILSNMGDLVQMEIERSCKWLTQFDVQVWSNQLRIAKPDPRIYMHTAARLSVFPEEILFLDDRFVNVQAARRLGMRSLVFFTMNQLERDIASAGMDCELPGVCA